MRFTKRKPGADLEIRCPDGSLYCSTHNLYLHMKLWRPMLVAALEQPLAARHIVVSQYIWAVDALLHVIHGDSDGIFQWEWYDLGRMDYAIINDALMLATLASSYTLSEAAVTWLVPPNAELFSQISAIWLLDHIAAGRISNHLLHQTGLIDYITADYLRSKLTASNFSSALISGPVASILAEIIFDLGLGSKSLRNACLRINQLNGGPDTNGEQRVKTYLGSSTCRPPKRKR